MGAGGAPQADCYSQCTNCRRVPSGRARGAQSGPRRRGAVGACGARLAWPQDRSRVRSSGARGAECRPLCRRVAPCRTGVAACGACSLREVTRWARQAVPRPWGGSVLARGAHGANRRPIGRRVVPGRAGVAARGVVRRREASARARCAPSTRRRIFPRRTRHALGCAVRTGRERRRPRGTQRAGSRRGRAGFIRVRAGGAEAAL